VLVQLRRELPDGSAVHFANLILGLTRKAIYVASSRAAISEKITTA